MGAKYAAFPMGRQNGRQQPPFNLHRKLLMVLLRALRERRHGKPGAHVHTGTDSGGNHGVINVGMRGNSCCIILGCIQAHLLLAH